MAERLPELLDFYVGQLVMLRSGGPMLTVSGVRSDGAINVEWFAGDEMRRDAFLPGQLRLMSVAD